MVQMLLQPRGRGLELRRRPGEAAWLPVEVARLRPRAIRRPPILSPIETGFRARSWRYRRDGGRGTGVKKVSTIGIVYEYALPKTHAYVRTRFESMVLSTERATK